MNSLWLFLTACELFGGRVRHPPVDEDSGRDPLDTELVDTDTDPADPCPAEMALVDESVCVDRWEAFVEEADGDAWIVSSPYQTIGPRVVRAVSRAGSVPQGYISGLEAAAACENAGKRLCTSAEWLAACRSPDGRTYPYGSAYDAAACNDTYEGSHPVIDYFDSSGPEVWDSAQMNDPGINQQPNTVAPAGQFGGCVSASSIFDLHGNLHEWVDDAAGTFRGGFYADAVINGAGCSYATTAHASNYHDYSTGFRCCADPDTSDE